MSDAYARCRACTDSAFSIAAPLAVLSKMHHASADCEYAMSEQHELESMAAAGMTNMQVIVAATSRAAEYMSLDKMGLLAVGKEADFLVLDANPLDNITNTQRISRIYLKGVEVNRAALRPSLTRPQ